MSKAKHEPTAIEIAEAEQARVAAAVAAPPTVEQGPETFIGVPQGQAIVAAEDGATMTVDREPEDV